MSTLHPDTGSWGRLHQRQRKAVKLERDVLDSRSVSRLPFGNGRSYGDSCHNDDGELILCRAQNRILSFDDKTGILRAQSGILLSDILKHISTTGWFLPVVPGTRFVTLGGAIANDIHGKNHEHAGTFGRWVKRFWLLRSGLGLIECSPASNHELFGATIAGLGLTGVITEAEIQLKKVSSHFVEEQKTEFQSINDFMDITGKGESDCEYSVAWVDSLATGKSLGRGILIEGNHVERDRAPVYDDPKINVPFTPPVPLVAGLPLRLFNFAYRKANSRPPGRRIASPGSFFFPLDALGGWNRLYGPRGLFQHQCVIPDDAARTVIPELMRASQHAGHGSFLTVLKRFGTLPSPGLLSFPKAGYTLTLDFPNRGKTTLELLSLLDAMTIDAGGRINPYKDARMSAATFQAGFPNWEILEAQRDPAISSNFWKRVAGRRVVRAPELQSDLSNLTVNQAAQPEVQEVKL